MEPAEISARIDEWFAFTRGGSHPGAAVLVMRDGAPMHRRGYGLADLDARASITPDTAFYLCSLAKAFTAMAVMLLAEAGRLGYDDTLPRYFPELPAFARPITVRHLLHHTSGLPDHFHLSQRRDLAELAGFTNEDVLAWLCRLVGPDFPPGERRQYSNAGYVLLAMLVARVANQPFHRFLHDRIFAPLGMARTLVYDPARPVVPDLAPAYFSADPPANGYVRWDYPLLTAGGGGVFSTLDDMARWDRALAEGRLVGPETLRAAYTPGRLNDGTAFGYGFGWEIGQLRERRLLAHTGGLAAYHARYLRFPDERLSVIVLANADRVDAVACAAQIADLCLADD